MNNNFSKFCKILLKTKQKPEENAWKGRSVAFSRPVIGQDQKKQVDLF